MYLLKKLVLFALFLLFSVGVQSAIGQGIAEDTVWTKATDQAEGFGSVKFSDNDSIIVGRGWDNNLFFNAITGVEIKRIPGNNEVFFFNEDNNYIQLNQSRNSFDIFDTKTSQYVESLENDGTMIPEFTYPRMSNDKHYIVAQISHGFRIWDVITKKILKTKVYEPEPKLIYCEVEGPQFNCDNSSIIGQLVKTYENPNNPEQPLTYGSFVIYNLNSLDSVDGYKNARGFRVSKTCKYFVSATGDPTYGVEVYDFNTKELLWKIPINGPSLTGIEFSPDDKYLVTSNGPGANCLKIWSMYTGKEVYNYPEGGWMNINVNHKGDKIISSSGYYLFLLKTYFSDTSVFDENNPIIIFPNPTTNQIMINYNNPAIQISCPFVIYNLFGTKQKEIQVYLNAGENNIPIDTSELSNGIYFATIKSGTEIITKQFVIMR